MPPPGAPPDRDKGILREWRIIEALDGTEVPHTKAVGVCSDAVGARPPVLPDGLRRRLVTDGPRRTALARAVRQRSRRARRAWLTNWPRASRCCPRWTGRPRGWTISAAPTAFTNARSTGGSASSNGSRGARSTVSTPRPDWLRAHRPLDFIPGLMHGDYQFANVMYQHGAPAQLAAIVDWEMGTVGDPKLDLGWMVQSWPADTDAPEQSGDELCRHAWDAFARPRSSSITPKVSGRQVDDLDYYLVLAKWKLAIVLEQGFQRAGDDEKLLAYGPDHHRVDAFGRRPRRIQRLPVRAAVCPAYGPPDVVRIEELPTPAVAAGQVRVRVGAAAVNFPDVLLIANQYQVSVPPPFVPGSEFAGTIVETGEGTEGFAVGDRVTGIGNVRRLRRGGRRAGRRAGADPRRRRRSARPPRSGWRTARRITRCGRWRGCRQATR